jgi:hypothetical protein
MSRLTAVALVLALQAPVLAGVGQVRPTPADAVVRLLSDLETALESGRLAAVQALAPRGLAPEDAARVGAVIDRGPIANVAVRERFRRPLDDGIEVLAEVFVSYGRQARVGTWRLVAEASQPAATRLDLRAIGEIASIDGLIKLTMDRTRQFALHNFVLDAPDLTLKMPSGTAFIAESPSGITALVLLGDGEVEFSPDDPAEQGQLRILNDAPTLSSRVEAAYVRMSPQEMETRAEAKTLVETRLDPRRLQRAQEIFDLLAPRTFNLELGGLSADRWSLEPTPGNIVVEFQTRRFGWLTYSLAPNEAEDVSVFDRARSRNIAVYTSNEQLSRRGRFYSDDTNTAFDVEHYAIDLTFNPERSWLTGRAAVRVRTRARLAGTLTFRLAAPLSVTSVAAVGLGPLMALRVTGQNSVLVSLPAPVDRNTPLTIEMTYSGRLDSQSIDREAITPQGVTQSQQPESREQLIPEARWLYSNRTAWYPQGSVTDYATARLRLSVPAEYQIIASGTLVNKSTTRADPLARDAAARSMLVVEYVADRPLRYLACVISRFVLSGRDRIDVSAIAPASIVPSLDTVNPFAAVTPSAAPLDERGRSTVGVEIISTPRMSASNRQLVPRVAAMLRYYASMVGEAPYPDFTLAALDDNLPGGHSPAFFALIHQPLPTTPYSWSSDPVSFDMSYAHFFLAHEVAHQWWGQAVGWKNYHEQWLSEGLAQYFALLYAGADRGAETARNLLGQMRSSAMQLSKNGPVYLGYRLGHIQNDGRIFRGLVYNKSALVLHMLRTLVGDAAFLDGLRRFYQDFRFQKAGTGDLIKAMEAAAGRPLDRFFTRWVFNAEIPRVRATLEKDASGASVLRVEQLGVSGGLAKAEEVFDVPVTFAIQYADGTTEDVVVSSLETVTTRKLAKPARRASVREELTLADFVR